MSYSGNKRTKGSLHHFAVNALPDKYSAVRYRLNVIEDNKKVSNKYMLLDANTCIYDLSGNIVWYMPELKGITQQSNKVRDIKATSAGTITMLYGRQAIEINYEGEVKWVAPDNGEVSGDRMEKYHHQLDRLANGHYMVMGDEFVNCRSRKDKDSMPVITGGAADMHKNGGMQGLPFATLIEYDAKGKVVWSWKTSKCYVEMNIADRYPLGLALLGDMHGNAFYLDVLKKKVYISYRNINSVFEIDYPSGKVTNIIDGYNTKLKTNEFCGQHSCRISTKGEMYLYNNNSCATEGMATIVNYKKTSTGAFEKNDEYAIPRLNDSFAIAQHSKDRAGGNVLEMKGEKLFISNSSPFNSLLIIDRNKKELLWQAMLERRDIQLNKWQSESNYRASIIDNDKDLDALLWQKKK